MARNLSFVCALTLSVAWLVASTTTAQAQVGEVAILTGVLSNGATIPLPSYADGSQALESECHWMVSVSAFAGMEGGAPPAEMHCFTEGRVVRVYWCAQSNCTPGIVGVPGQTGGMANYLIIAVRAGAPTPTRAGTWGQVKARYHTTPGMTVTPGADNR